MRTRAVSRAIGALTVDGLTDERRAGCAADQGVVAEVDQHARSAPERADALGGDLDGVPGAELRLLDDRVDAFRQCAPHLVRQMADDDSDVACAGHGDQVDDPIDERPARQAGAGPCGGPTACESPAQRRE